MFDYSKCTYKELNLILDRFRKSITNRVCHKNASWDYFKLAKDEYGKIVEIIKSGRYLDKDTRYNNFYNLERYIVNTIHNKDELVKYISKNYFCSNNIDEVRCNAMLKARQDRLDELRYKECKIENLKEGNKRRFLLKGRV